ncbi:MAG TPA: M48 family metallopeptidase [Steroidobacteraceae bacterium]|nr:M48 family metallopeptidase [Steroidobacteraceae bacterium]
MLWLTAAFLIALVCGTALRLWLAARQIAAARDHRERVPEPFSNQVPLADHRKAADYTVARARLARIETVVDALVVLGLTLGGGIAGIEALWLRLDWREPWGGLAVVLSVAAITAVVGLPFSIWRTFRIEAAFGFNRISPRLFLIDRVKGLLLALAIGGPLVLAALTLMERAGRRWWLYVWLVWLAVSWTLAWAWPAFIAPLFNHFTPLGDASLKARIETLLARCGFASKGVFVVDSSRRTAHGNAYFTGVGRSKRIVFFDSLLERLGAAEIEAVLAHELGHFRLKHIRQGLILSAAASLAGLALLGWLAHQGWFYAALGVHAPSAASALLLFLLVAPVFLFFLTPLTASWSRRHEFAADRFAAEHANAADLAAALVKLYRDNATTLTPDRINSAFYDSHPPALARIAYLNQLASRRSASAATR